MNLPQWQERYAILCEQLEKVDAQELEKAKRDTGMGSDDEDEAEKAVDGEEAQDGHDKKADEQEVEGGEAEAESSTPKPKKKPRQSQLDISAIQAEQSNLDPNLILQLRLTKKYYSDALKFITALESATPTLSQLLVSTNKTEVLEAIRFFRLAYEYNLVGAEVGIKTMLHLIWTKDNTSTAASDDAAQDGKGIRGSLIDTYKSLYFDVVPDLSPKQQVSRIAKNMIE